MKGYSHFSRAVRNRMRNTAIDALTSDRPSQGNLKERQRWRGMSLEEKKAESRRQFEEAMERANTEAPKDGER